MQDRKKENRIAVIVTETVCAILLGAGSFKALTNLFSLEWGSGNRYSGGFMSGIVKLWNDIADAFGDSSFTLLTKYAGGGNSEGLVLTLILAAFIAISYFIVRSRVLWFALLYLVPLAVLPIGFKLYPGYLPVIAITAGLALLAGLKNLEDRVGIWPIVIASVCGAMAFGLCFNPYTRDLLDRPAPVENAAERVTSSIDKARYGENPLGDGTFADNRKKGTAMVITMEEPEALYLRGFVGEELSGNKWTALGTDDHYKARDLSESLGNAGFKALGQLGQAAELAGSEESEYEGRIRIEVENASSRYAYVPYEIKTGSVSGTKDWNSSFLTGKGMRGAREYSYTSYGNLTGVWTDVTGKLYSAQPSEEMNRYVAAESHYNTWVYKNYVEMTDEQVKAVSKILGQRPSSENGHTGYKSAIKNIQSYFDSNVIYTDRVKDADDPLETIFEKKKGNDTHYATAAAMMFRYYGIPARYVEGYLVTLDDAMEMEPEEAYKISMKNEHAWTEIYVDGVGWVPIEICSEYYGVMPEADMSIGLENKTQNNPFNKPNTATQSKVVTDEDAENIRTIPWKLVLLIIGLVLLAALIAFVLYRLIKFLIAYVRRRRAFGQPDAKGAICAIYDYARTRKLALSESAVLLGTEAAYSNHAFTEEDRKKMLEALKEAGRKK